MADSITSMPEANAAYQVALAALQRTHENLDAITAATPVNWDAYNAGLQACTTCQGTAQSALSVLQAAILDTPGVQELIGKLKSDTQTMNQAAAALDKTAAAFKTLTVVATTLASILTTILRFA